MNIYLRSLLKRAPHLYAWEKEYRQKGKLWRGVSTSFDFSNLPAGAKVLELGCGDGKTLAALVANDFAVTGVDVSPTAIKLARQKVGRKAKLVVGDVCKLPFASGSFDAVVAVHVFDHLNEAQRKKAFKEVNRVLKKRGVLFFEGFSKKDFRFGKGTELEKNTFRRGNNVWYHYFSLSEVKRLFAEFSILQICEAIETRNVAGQLVKRAVVKLVCKKA